MEFKGLPRISWRRDFFPTSLIVGVLVAFVLLAVRVVAIDSPVMGSDEYAYFQTAHFDSARETLFALDPNLQRVDNKVYPWLYRLWSLASDQRIADVGRLFNALVFVLCALLLFAIFQRLFERRVALIASLLYLLFPFSVYATMLLPEVEFQCFVYVLVAIWLYGGITPSWQRILMAAGASALGYLIKPHALAVIAASIAWLCLNGWISPAEVPFVRRLWNAFWRPAIYACATYFFIKAIGYLLDPDSSGAVVSSFYAGYLTRLKSAHYLITHLASTGVYALGHIWVICVFFIPAAPMLAGSAWHWLRNARGLTAENERETEQRAMAMFLLLLVLSMIAMVAVFTDAAASGSDFEQGRLHGRYLAAVLPLLLGYAVAGVGERHARGIAAAGLVSLWTFAFFGNRIFKLYPWDYPDLFGLFRAVPGGWSFDGALKWPFLWTILLGSAFWIVFAFGRRKRLIYASFIAASMLCAHMQTGAWLAAQSRTSQASIDAGNAIAAYLGEQSAGKGMIITTERFGRASYLLAAIDSLQYVRWAKPSEHLHGTDIPEGVQWAVADDAVTLDLPNAAQLTFGPYRLFLIGRGIAWPALPSSVEWGGEPLTLPFAQLGGLSKFHGFHAAEPWGRWSNGPDASLDLPVRLSGPLVVHLFAWSSNPAGDDMTLTLGDSKAVVRLTGKPADHLVTLMPSRSADRLEFHAESVDRAGTRPMGVAIGRIDVRRP